MCCLEPLHELLPKDDHIILGIGFQPIGTLVLALLLLQRRLLILLDETSFGLDVGTRLLLGNELLGQLLHHILLGGCGRR